jgi:hypothetical protein
VRSALESHGPLRYKKTMKRPPVHSPSFYAPFWGISMALLLFLGTPARSLVQNNASQSGTQDQHGSTDKKDSKSSEPATTKLHIHVLTDAGKPIANASVYVRFSTEGGFLHHDKLAEMNFKTNGDGSVKVPEIPQGKILIQVIAAGWHTYGEWYDENKNEDTIEIKLAPPHHWY